MVEIGVCSFSFHRLLAAGKQDVFQYILDCKRLGSTQLDPWNAHLSALKDGEGIIFAGRNPGKANQLSAVDDAYIAKVKDAAKRVGLPFGCIAVDGAHVYEESAEKRGENRRRAYRWIEIAGKLAAREIRIDAGGTAAMPGPELEIILEGYADLKKRCGDIGAELVMENHFGSSATPANVVKICEGSGIGL